MGPGTHQFDSLVHLGPFAVRADPADVAEFAAALELPATDTVPLTFPVRWLACPAVRNAMQDAVGTPHPLLASQSLRFHADVGPGRPYSLSIAIQREDAGGSSVTVRGTLHDDERGPAVEIETVLCPATAAAALRGRKAPASVLPEIAVGPIDLPYVVRYASASGDHNRLHVDDALARSVGFDGPIVHGMLTMGLFEKALRQWRGEVRVARLFARFVRPVHVGSQVAIGGRLAPPAGRASGSEELVRLSVRTGDWLVCLGEASMRDARSHPPAS